MTDQEKLAEFKRKADGKFTDAEIDELCQGVPPEKILTKILDAQIINRIRFQALYNEIEKKD